MRNRDNMQTAASELTDPAAWIVLLIIVVGPIVVGLCLSLQHESNERERERKDREANQKRILDNIYREERQLKLERENKSQ